MSILVTVGTTPFDELIEEVDSGDHAARAFLQIASGAYTPKVARWGRFVDDFQNRCKAADIVVCHGGAGSVFGLLQSGVCPIVVPNLVRRDVHQVELGRWLERNRYAPVAWNLSEVNALISCYDIEVASYRRFDVEPYFFAEQLNDDIRGALSKSK
jgi:beta-1,4-N-acetylglucosaminyltransferase